MIRKHENINADGTKTIYTINADGNRDGITTTLDKNGVPCYVIHYSDGVFMGMDRVIQSGKIFRHYSFSGDITLEGEIIVYG